MAGIFSLAIVQAQEPSISKQCHTQESAILGRSVPYCIYRTRADLPAKPGEPVVYFFHGIFSDEKGFEADQYLETLKQLQAEAPLPAINFVTFATEDLSYFVNHGDLPSGKQAYETWFIQEFMPFVEKEYRLCHERRCRAVLGNSMGGWGALQYGLRYSRLFSLLAANSPAILPYNIFDPMNKWFQYFHRHPVGYIKGSYLLLNARHAFLKPEFYDEHNPLVIVSKMQLPQRQELPAIYFDVGGKDFYGFEEGYQLLVEKLRNADARFTSDFYPDGVHNIKSQPERRAKILRFLTRTLAPSLEPQAPAPGLH